MPGAPFLFTIAGLADDAAEELPPLPPLSEEAKVALRQEVALADEYANMVGREICGLLLRHRLRIQAAISSAFQSGLRSASVMMCLRANPRCVPRLLRR